jgi:hypothetical protein
VEYFNGSRVLCEHIRKTSVCHPAFVQIGAHEHDAASTKPIVYFSLLKAPFGFHSPEQTAGAMDG